jgi:hypothetical protein
MINILIYYIQKAGSLTSKSELNLTTNANMQNLLSFLYYDQLQI